MIIFCLLKVFKQIRRKNFIENLNVDDGKWQIKRESLDHLYKIGSGNFGEVFKGILQSQEQIEVVAIKMLKYVKIEGINDDEFFIRKITAEKTFVDEARRMTKLNTCHIIKLRGYCLTDKPFMVVMEFAEHGDLLSYLRKHHRESEEVSSTYVNNCNSTIST